MRDVRGTSPSCCAPPTWAPEFGGRNGFPPPEKNELALSIEKGCADTVPFQTRAKHPVLTRPISNPQDPFSAPKFWSPATNPRAIPKIITHERVIVVTEPRHGRVLFEVCRGRDAKGHLWRRRHQLAGWCARVEAATVKVGVVPVCGGGVDLRAVSLQHNVELGLCQRWKRNARC